MTPKDHAIVACGDTDGKTTDLVQRLSDAARSTCLAVAHGPTSIAVYRATDGCGDSLQRSLGGIVSEALR